MGISVDCPYFMSAMYFTGTAMSLHASSLTESRNASIPVLFILFLISSCATQTQPSSKKELLEESELIYVPIGENYWGGTIIKAIRMFEKEKFPGSLTLDGRKATLETAGSRKCRLEYELKKDTYTTFHIKGKGKIQREVFEATRGGSSGPCSQFRYLSVGGYPEHKATTLRISWSRRLNGRPEYYANFSPDLYAKNLEDKLRCSEFITAAYERDLQAVVEYVDTLGVDVNCKDDQKGSALWSSLLDSRGSNRGGNTFAMVQFLVDRGADVKYRREGRSISYFATYKGRTKSASYIVANGGSIEEAKAGNRARGFNDAALLGGIAGFAATLSKGKEVVGNAIREGHRAAEESRARLGVTARYGIYKTEQDGNVTRIYCNRSPELAHVIRRNDSGSCRSSLSLGDDCADLLRQARDYCN